MQPSAGGGGVSSRSSPSSAYRLDAASPPVRLARCDQERAHPSFAFAAARYAPSPAAPPIAIRATSVVHAASSSACCTAIRDATQLDTQRTASAPLTIDLDSTICGRQRPKAIPQG
jgi:hypothetical protein